MNFIYNLILLYGSNSELFLNIAIKAFVIILTGLILTSIFRRFSASVKNSILNMTFCCLTIIPLLSIILPQKDLGILPLSNKSAQGKGIQSIDKVISESSDVGINQINTSHDRTFPEREEIRNNTGDSQDHLISGSEIPEFTLKSVSFFTWTVIIWLSVGFLFFTRLVLQNLYLGFLCSKSNPVRDPGWKNDISTYSRMLDIRYSVRIVSGKEIKVPAAYGIFRPSIMIPERLVRISGEKRRTILLHELAHIKRYDHLFNLIVQIVCVLYWYNPLTWYAAKKQRKEREKACDDLVINTGVESSEYASQLIEIARLIPRSNSLTKYAVTMAEKSQLKGRISHILQNKIPRNKISQKTTVICIFVFLTFSLLFAGTRITEDRPAVEYDRELEELLAALKTDHSGVKKTAAWSLGEREDPGAVPALIEALNDNDPEVIVMAAWALGEIKDKRAIKPLIKTLASENAFVREMIVKAIGEHENPGTIDILILILKNDIPNVQQAALWALGEIKDYSAFKVITNVLDSENSSLKEIAIESAVKCNPVLAVPKLIDLVSDENRKIRSKAIYYLGELKAEQCIENLITTLTDVSPQIRTCAAQALGKIGDPAAVEPLINTLSDKDPGVRAMAVWALDEINVS